jgi:hypothetical protein
MNKDILPPIILSSSVQVMDKSVLLQNPSERIRYTLESIENWLQISPNIRLIICDGSNYDFSGILANKYPKHIQNGHIECLYFMNDLEKVALFGKGFGEGEIIQYTLEHSKLLQADDFFCKCTGKLWVDNFLDCLSEWNGRFLCQAYFANVFSWKKTSFDYIDTRFYLADKVFYKKYFSQLHLKVGGHYQCSIEDVFKQTILENQLTGSLFKCLPLVRGVGGGSGKYYKSNFIRRNKDRLRLRLIQNNPTFSAWFNHG